MKKLFTLIELITVIVVLGILSVIVIPNISSWQKEATVAAIESNINNTQTALDMYSLKNYGDLPIKEVDMFKPTPIDFRKIHPDQIRNLPKTKDVIYWVDAWGKVWASSVDAPSVTSMSNGILSWDEVEDSTGYRVYEIFGYNGTNNVITASLKKSSLKLVDEISGSNVVESTKVEVGKAYIVSAIDKDGFETAPAGEGYSGYEMELDNFSPIGEIPIKEIPVATLPVSSNSIESGANHAFIKKDNGDIYAMGLNSCGQLGTGDQVNRTTPVLVESLKGVSKISAAGHHSLALQKDGKVLFFGCDTDSLGRGLALVSHTPVVMEGLTDIIDIETGFFHSLALSKDGDVYSWGVNHLSNQYSTSNDFTGQTGLSLTGGYIQVPTKITTLPPIKKIFASGNNSYAVTEDGTVYGWGENSRGQLGLGTSDVLDKNKPIELPLMKNALEINQGVYFSMARFEGETIKSWGVNAQGQLGNGTTTNNNVPLDVLFNLKVKSIEALSLYSNYRYGDGSSFAILEDGSLYSWGNNTAGQLGINVLGNKNVPTLVPNVTNVTEISAGGEFAIAKTNDGKYYMWGRNANFKWPSGTYSSVPVSIPLP